MRCLKTKPLYSLLLSALAGAASAVNLSNDGTGQVLIYPYYTVRSAGPGDWATYLNVVNHTSDTKALRLRFREGLNGRSVFDMNLYLSAGDMWAGAVSKTGDGAQLISADASCVTSAGSYSQSVAAGKLSPTFSNAMYVGPSTTQAVFDGDDLAGTSLDRTREGFFEIIEMGIVTSTAVLSGLKHNSSAIPANCSVVTSIDSSALGAPRGGLSGGASLIHVLKGADFGYDPVVLEDFYRAPTASDNLWTTPGNRLPDLSQATPVSRIFYLHGSTTAGTPDGIVTDVLETAWDRGIDAVSAVLMRDSIKNSYVLDDATQSSTDWIITMPTKHHYISANVPGSSFPNDPNGSLLLPPFHNFFSPFGSCETYTATSENREGEQYFWHGDPFGIGEPYPPFELCAEASVLTLKRKDFPSRENTNTLLGSKNRTEHQTTFSNGWVNLRLNVQALPLVGRSLIATTFEAYYGLPVIGFMVQDFVNTNVMINGRPATASYGGNFNHKYTRSISGGNVRP